MAVDPKQLKQDPHKFSLINTRDPNKLWQVETSAGSGVILQTGLTKQQAVQWIADQVARADPPPPPESGAGTVPPPALPLPDADE